MYIHEAIIAAKKNNTFITRSAWDYKFYAGGSGVKLEPTDSPDGCIVMSGTQEKARHGWQPIASDLIADDWELVL